MSDLSSLERRMVAAERSVEREVGEAQALVRQVNESKADSVRLREMEVHLEEAISVLSGFADIRQAEVHSKIEGLVTEGLQTIFGEELRFKITQELRARRMETRFSVISVVDGDDLETDVLNARGGGVAAVVGFLLRLLVVLLSPNRRPFLFLDEAFGQLSADKENRLAEFLRDLVDKTSAQLVLVTHSETFGEYADVVYRFSQKDGKTQVKEISYGD